MTFGILQILPRIETGTVPEDLGSPFPALSLCFLLLIVFIFLKNACFYGIIVNILLTEFHESLE